MADAPKILNSDTLLTGYDKINKSIDNSNEALTKSTESLSNSESTQTQLDQVVIDGDSSVEAAQARVDADGNSYATLKDRLDTEHTDVTSQLADIAINVKEYGAVGDGVTDDWQAITDAMEKASQIYGGMVYFPDGNYAVGQTLVIPKNIKIKGVSRKGVNVKALTSITGHLFDASADGQGKVTISEISLQGHADMKDAIFLNNAKGNTIISDCLFTTFRNGVNFYGDKNIYDDGSWGAIVFNCYFSDISEYGVAMRYGSNGNIVYKNQFWNSANGVLVQFGRACTVEGNILQELAGKGVSVESCFETNVENNYFEANGIDVLITKEINEPEEGYTIKTVVSKNIFVGATENTHAVKIDYGRHTTINDNWSRNHTTAFVETSTNSVQTKIKDNYSAFEALLNDSGFGTITKFIDEGKEKIDGTTSFEDLLEISNTNGKFKLSTYSPSSPIKAMLFYDSNVNMASLYDGTKFRRAFFPAGIVSITSPNTSLSITSANGFTDQPNAGYGVLLTTNQPKVRAYYTSKATTGFTINIEGLDGQAITYPVEVTWQLII